MTMQANKGYRNATPADHHPEPAAPTGPRASMKAVAAAQAYDLCISEEDARRFDDAEGHKVFHVEKVTAIVVEMLIAAHHLASEGLPEGPEKPDALRGAVQDAVKGLERCGYRLANWLRDAARLVLEVLPVDLEPYHPPVTAEKAVAEGK